MIANRKRKSLGHKVHSLIMKRDKNTCQLCGSHINSSQQRKHEITQRWIPYYHIDHIVPFSKGGSDEMSNLQLTCVKCNIRKGNRVIS